MSKTTQTTLKAIVAAALTVAAGIAAAKPSMTDAEFDAYVHRAGAPKLVLTPAHVTGASYSVVPDVQPASGIVKGMYRTIVHTDAATAVAMFDSDKTSTYRVGDEVGTALIYLPDGAVRLYVVKKGAN